jgi:cob(I)alamin adenosyltransferase
MVQIYTGTGKGKTTASLGLICRALGNNFKVCLIQFMKRNADYSEIKFLSKQDNLEIHQFGTPNFVNPEKPEEVDFEEADKAYKKAKEILESGKYDLVVIDEINVAVSWKLLPLEKQLELMDIKGRAEIVMTGRYADPEVVKRAHLVTEMLEIKHYYTLGKDARKGIEF